MVWLTQFLAEPGAFFGEQAQNSRARFTSRCLPKELSDPPPETQKANGETDQYSVDAVLRQIARSMVGNPDVPTVLIDHITTVKDALRAVATSLQDDDTQIILFHEQSPDERKALRTAAQSFLQESASLASPAPPGSQNPVYQP